MTDLTSFQTPAFVVKDNIIVAQNPAATFFFKEPCGKTIQDAFAGFDPYTAVMLEDWINRSSALLVGMLHCESENARFHLDVFRRGDETLVVLVPETFPEEFSEHSGNMYHNLGTYLLNQTSALVLAEFNHKRTRNAESDRIINSFARLGHNLLALAEISDGRSETLPVLCDAKELCEQVISEADAYANDIRLVLNADMSVPIAVDIFRIRRILFNLLCNAFAADPTVVTVTLTASEKMCLITVADNGHGMNADQFGNIWRRRMQFELLQSGSGLGLTIAQFFAEQAGGSLLITSGKDGTVINLSLPIWDDNTLSAPQNPQIFYGNLADIEFSVLPQKTSKRQDLRHVN